MIQRMLALLAVALLCGCFKVTDELTLNADGSGVVRIQSHTTIPSEMLGAMNLNRRGQNALYPPVSAAEANYFFPDKDFIVTAKEQKNEKRETIVTIEARFKEVNALLASPYAKAHALTIHTDNGVLRVRAVSGIEAAARYAEIKDVTGQMPEAYFGREMEKQKQEMRTEFRVVLPNAVSAPGGEAKGNAATWVFERSQFTNGIEFAEKSGMLLEASCPATGVTLSPTNPPRLALTTFSDVQAGALTAAASIDTKKISEQAKFVPYALYVTRTLDLSGEGSFGGNEAKLIGAVVLPKEFAPQRWGKAKLEEAIDAKGADLKPKDRERFSSHFFGRQFGEDDDGEESEETAEGPRPQKSSNVERRPVTLTFQPPDWNVNEIARVKGKIELQYFSRAEVLQLSNAIPARSIVDPSDRQAVMGLGMEGGERALAHPRLSELGLTLRLAMAMAQSGTTMLMLQVQGNTAGIGDVQVYDARGKAWPTFVQPGGFGGNDNSITLSVPGQPEAPLSLALIVNSGGTAVEVPILVEKMAVRGK